MNITIIIILIILVFLVIYVAIGLFTMTVNDFIEKNVKKFLWLWLPFHALKRLSKEFSKKYLK
ncbi:MAG: hypothetical protein HGA36_04970 [Candidatus Moranbacteria bacterium]|nr:hypothetical protein [Candidatus Moranbacteria bacterium]